MSTATVYPSNDTWIDENAPTTNWNGRPEIRVGDQGGAGKAKGILRFTMPSDPGGGNAIDSIVLWLKVESIAGTMTTMDVYQGTNTPATTFVEGQATHNIYSTGNNWTTAGARDDFNSSIIDSNTGVSTDETFYSWDLLAGGATNDVTIDWGEELALQVIDGTPQTAFQTDFYNKDTTGTASDPYIIVTYSVASTDVLKSVNGLAKASIKSWNGVVLE